MLPQQGHERAVVALDSIVSAGRKGKQKKNSAIPRCVNAKAKVLSGIRRAHKNQILVVCATAVLPVFRLLPLVFVQVENKH